MFAILPVPELADTMMPMASAKEVDNPATNFTQVLNAAAKLPGVRISREQYLRSALRRYCSEEQIELAVRTSPANAGIPSHVISEIADTSIRFETSKVTGLSTVAGIPGGLAMVGTVPADLVQYMGHVLRIAQKLAYIYSWPDLFSEREDLDEATKGVLTLFVGVMFGVQIAQGGVTRLAGMIAANVARKLPQRALTKGLVYPIVKQVSKHIGLTMTRRVFANGVAKAIPLVGAVFSGGLTFATFLPMSKRLKRHLASLELTKPDYRGDRQPTNIALDAADDLGPEAEDGVQ